MRRFLLLLLAVAALFAAAIGAVAYLNRDLLQGSGGPTAPAPLAEASPEAAPGPLPPSAEVPPAPVARPPAPVQLLRRPPVVPQAGEWEAIAPVSAERVPNLGRAINQAHTSLVPCFDPDVQARYGTHPVATVGSPRPGGVAPVLLVELETAPDGQVRVVGAPVESRGAADDGQLACIQAQLRGLQLPGQGTPGARYRVRYAMDLMAASLPKAPPRAARVRLKKP